MKTRFVLIAVVLITMMSPHLVLANTRHQPIAKDILFTVQLLDIMSHRVSDDDLLALQAHFEQSLATNTFQKDILLPAANLYQAALQKNLTDLETDLGEALKEFNADLPILLAENVCDKCDRDIVGGAFKGAAIGASIGAAIKSGTLGAAGAIGGAAIGGADAALDSQHCADCREKKAEAAAQQQKQIEKPENPRMRMLFDRLDHNSTPFKESPMSDKIGRTAGTKRADLENISVGNLNQEM